MLRRNAAARILHHERGIFPGGNHLVAQRPDIGRRNPPGCKREPAASVSARLHGIARIDRKIDDNLLKLGRIGTHRPQIAVVHHRKLDLLADQPLEHLRNV